MATALFLKLEGYEVHGVASFVRNCVPTTRFPHARFPAAGNIVAQTTRHR